MEGPRPLAAAGANVKAKSTGSSDDEWASAVLAAVGEDSDGGDEIDKKVSASWPPRPVPPSAAAAAPGKRTYFALEVIVVINKVIAWFSMVGAVLGFFFIAGSAEDSPPEAAGTAGAAALMVLATGAVVALVFLASAELIKLMIHIQEDTYATRIASENRTQ